MAGVKTINEYTCADCKNHKCNFSCRYGKKSCSGECLKNKKKKSCSVKICSNFVLDKLVRMC